MDGNRAPQRRGVAAGSDEHPEEPGARREDGLAITVDETLARALVLGAEALELTDLRDPLLAVSGLDVIRPGSLDLKVELT